MRRTVSIMIAGALLAGIATTAMAKSEKKNRPKSTRVVAEEVEAAGEEHFPEKMKIRQVGSMKFEETYYHVYCGILRNDKYRVILFDNTPRYIGYYETEYEPTDFDEDSILLDTENINDDGEIDYEKIRITTKGPVDRATIDSVKVDFIKAPEKEEPKVAAGTDAEGAELEFRIWTISQGGRKHQVRAMYVEQTFGRVTLRAEASGRVNSFPISSLSAEDKAYIEQFK